MARPKSEGERPTVRTEVLFKPSEDARVSEHLQGEAARRGKPVRRATWLHDLTMRAVAGELGAPEHAVPLIGSAICGPWQDAVADTHDVLRLSEHTADVLEMRDGDIFVRAYGESMERAGIIDGALVLLRPLARGVRPRQGEITLVQIHLPDGACLSTIKHWHETGAAPRLTNADGHDYPIPPDAERIEPVAVARGVMSRL